MSDNKISNSNPRTFYPALKQDEAKISSVDQAETSQETSNIKQSSTEPKEGKPGDTVEYGSSASRQENYYLDNTKAEKHSTPVSGNIEPKQAYELIAERAEQAHTEAKNQVTKDLESLTTFLLNNSEIFGEDDFYLLGLGYGKNHELSQDLVPGLYDKITPNASDLAKMLEDPKRLEKAITKGLPNLDTAQKSEIVEIITTKLSQKLATEVMGDVRREIHALTDAAHQKIEPFLDANPAARMLLAAKLIKHEPPLNPREMATHLQEAGLSREDAKALSKEISSLKGSDIEATLSKALKGERIALDGALKAFDDQIKSAFENTYKEIDVVRTQVSNDSTRGHKAITNPLFAQAFKTVCEEHGIDISSSSKSEAGEILREMIKDQKISNEIEKKTCEIIVKLALKPFTGVAGFAVNRVAEAPDLILAQHDLNAARGAETIGIADQSYVDEKEKARDKAFKDTAVGAVKEFKGLKGSVEELPTESVGSSMSDAANTFFKGVADVFTEEIRNEAERQFAEDAKKKIKE